jgi:CBS domain-containing protein
MKVKKAMVKSPKVVTTNTSIRNVARVMKEDEIGSVIIVENNELKGILTERDLVRKVLTGEKDPRYMKVAEIMSKPVIHISEDSDLLEATKLMEKHNIGRLVVIDSSRNVVGILTTNDITKRFSIRIRDYLVRS